MRRPALLAALLATLLGLLAAACAGTGYRYVSHGGFDAHFKVPERWRLFDQDELIDAGAVEVDEEQLDELRSGHWLVAFDAAPEPALEHVGAGDRPHPWGIVRVRTLSPQERDAYSLAQLRAEFTEVDPLAAAGQGGNVEVLELVDIARDDGMRGSRIRFLVDRDDGGRLTLDQTALVDAETRTVYLLVVGCEQGCFEDHQRVIDEIVSSWTVRE